MPFAAILRFLSLAVPVWFATGQKAVIKGAKKAKEYAPKSNFTRNIILAVAAYLILKHFADKAAKAEAEGGLQTNPGPGGYQDTNALATQYFKAMFPSGYPWFPDGTDEEKLYELAAKTHNYPAVYALYTQLYNRSLTADLQAELGADEYQRFLSILNA